MARAPPLPPSPITTLTIGVRNVAILFKFFAMASACPLSSAPTPGKAPGVSIIVKIGYSAVTSQSFAAALVPGILKRVEFIIKDAKRFPATAGWGYARFLYDPAKDIFTPYGKDAAFVQECFSCHTIVRDRDFIFTKYPKR